MRTSGNDHADPVITSDDAAIANDGHDSTLRLSPALRACAL